jgi:hypothetical protein
MAPTTASMKPSSVAVSRRARSWSPAVSSAVSTGTKAALMAASAKSWRMRLGTTDTDTNVL